MLKRVLCVGVVLYTASHANSLPVSASAQSQEKSEAPPAEDTDTADDRAGTESSKAQKNSDFPPGDYPPATPRTPQQPERDRPEADETIETVGFLIGSVALLIAVGCAIRNLARKRSAG